MTFSGTDFKKLHIYLRIRYHYFPNLHALFIFNIMLLSKEETFTIIAHQHTYKQYKWPLKSLAGDGKPNLIYTLSEWNILWGKSIFYKETSVNTGSLRAKMCERTAFTKQANGRRWKLKLHVRFTLETRTHLCSETWWFQMKPLSEPWAPSAQVFKWVPVRLCSAFSFSVKDWQNGCYLGMLINFLPPFKRTFTPELTSWMEYQCGIPLSGGHLEREKQGTSVFWVWWAGGWLNVPSLYMQFCPFIKCSNYFSICLALYGPWKRESRSPQSIPVMCCIGTDCFFNSSLCLQTEKCNLSCQIHGFHWWKPGRKEVRKGLFLNRLNVRINVEVDNGNLETYTKVII